MRKVVLEEDHPRSKLGSRKAWMDCTKAELIFALETMTSRTRGLEVSNDALYRRIANTEEEYRETARKLRHGHRDVYDQMDTAIGSMTEEAKKRAEHENGAFLAMYMVRAIEVMLDEFALANPDTRSYEFAVTQYGADMFYTLCRMAKYVPRPNTASAVLYSRSYDRPCPDKNYYEYVDVHDATDDEFVEESLPSQQDLDY